MAIPSKPNAPLLDGPIPGQNLTAELGSRPWQTPPQFTTVEEALDYYIPRLQADEVTEQLLDVLEMGVPVTTVANTMQLASVMEGKHSVDVGMLVLPVLIEMIMLIADTAGIEYETGLQKGKSKVRGSLVSKALNRLQSEEGMEEEQPLEMEEPQEETAEEMMPEVTGGLMSRRA
jgi:hypothetical protein